MERRAVLVRAGALACIGAVAGCNAGDSAGEDDEESGERKLQKSVEPRPPDRTHAYAFEGASGESVRVTFDSEQPSAGAAVFDTATGATVAELGTGPSGEGLGPSASFTTDDGGEFVLWTAMPEGTTHTISVESGADDAETVSPTGPPAERIRSDVQRVREAVDGATPGLEQAFEAQFVWGRLPRQKYRSLTQRDAMPESDEIEAALSGLERDLDAAVAESGALQWIDDNEGQFVTIAAEAITTAIQLKLAGFGGSLQGTIEDQLGEFVEDFLSAETISESTTVELSDGTEATRTRLSLQGEFDLLQTVQVGMPCLLTTTVERGTVPPETTVEDVDFEPSEASVEIV